MSTAIELENLSLEFKSDKKRIVALDNVNLKIKQGEFFTLLGPSGSGKTSCLRLIGGFLQPNSGRILIGDKDITKLPANRRSSNTVFQDYGLFPHYSVIDNVAYGLMVRGVKKPERYVKAHQMLQMVGLSDFEKRKPRELSGGQQQRVALARSLILEPNLLLLDEPLGALDAKLRVKMQVELKEIQRKLNMTFVFVTHDQHEAMLLSDRIGVFNKGKLEQVATPEELYNRPATRFVAEFIGSANLFSLGKGGLFQLHPEAIAVGTAKKHKLKGTVAEQQYFGPTTRLLVEPESFANSGISIDQPVRIDIAHSASGKVPSLGETIYLNWEESDGFLLKN